MSETKRCALITGGSRGIGRAIAVSMAGEGYDLVIGYAGNSAKADETRELCFNAASTNGKEIRVISVQGDVATQEGAKALVEAAMNEFGRIDVLVNNAGITRDGLLMRMSTEDFDDVIATNLKGAFLMTREVARPMMKQRYGRIINLSSIVGLHGNAGQVNYSASKAGLIGLTKSTAKELASRNITCNAIAPGFIGTDMTKEMTDAAKEATLATIPMKKAGEPSDIANAALFLASEKSSYITGQVLGVDGGMGC
ncbi:MULTISPECIES: 3-oxoacyl-[acyl-carrier-protein] reductase [Butyrivibrio]|uniref:3-oxoacyl-[acyl-carrier-protein] reductase n=1 Tax=Butyrivibrio TaxID=830 RepID=UPI0003B349A1|nr:MULTISPECIES: 3-oxoacyl-[acyl-carrier-protein] reductase [Butyrivibrio]SEQ29212.1 3-oxoacyl-[acyl-carrier-protein] reductase [Butyrivibrio sp. TB]